MRLFDKNILLAFLLATVFIITSCSSIDNTLTGGENTNNPHNDNTRTVSLTASVEQNSRTGMINNGDGSASFYWHKGDAIGVQAKDKDGNYAYIKFTTDDETGARTATFIGEVPEDYEIQSYAIYPYYEQGVKFTGDKSAEINITPDINYPPIEDHIFPTTTDETISYPATSTNIIMAGTITDSAITFRHLGGLVVIRIDKIPSGDGQIFISSDQNLNGQYNVSDLSATDAQIETSHMGNGNTYYTIYYNKANAGAPAIFYLPMAVGSYTNLKFELSQSDKFMISIPYGSLEVKRGEIQAISLTSDSKGALRNVRALGNNEYLVNGRKFIDLGLESGLLWAETNIGSSSPYLPGDYFAWGETATKEEYTNDNATWASTEYPQTTLLPKDDAATAYCGSGIRIPTKEDLDELMGGKNTSRKWTYSYIGGLNREAFKISNNNDDTRCIYLPVTGTYNGTTKPETISMYPEANYWTSTASKSLTNELRTAYYMNGMPGSTYNIEGTYTLRAVPLYRGYCIRAVAEK